MSVADFFNQLAPTYRHRFDPQQAPWLAYWFGQRLVLTAAALRHPQEKILDVGCGTGALYDHLQQTGFQGTYWGCDVAEAMLAHSTIPPNRQISGTPLDDNFPDLNVDTIVVLGVTSYWTEAYVQDLLARLSDLIQSNGGQILISFTYSKSWDFQLRRRLQPFLARLGLAQQVVTRPIFATTPKELSRLLPSSLQLLDCQWLPGTLPLLPALFPRLACWVSRRLPYPPPSPLRTDFLVKLAPYA